MLTPDEKKIEELAKAQCTVLEIAASTHVSHDTLDRRYKQQIEAARLRGKAELRLAQWKKATKNGDANMLKHLGKHYLDQHEQVQISNTNEPEVRKLLAFWESHNTESATEIQDMNDGEPLKQI